MKITHKQEQKNTLTMDIMEFIEQEIGKQAVEKYFIGTTPSGATRIFHLVSQKGGFVKIYHYLLIEFFNARFVSDESDEEYILGEYYFNIERHDIEEMLSPFGLENSPSLEIKELTLSPKGVSKDV